MEEDLEDMPLASLAELRPSNDASEVESSSQYMESTVVASAINYRNDDDDDNSNQESLSESEARSDASSDEDSEEILPEAMPDEIPIDIPSSQHIDTKPNPPDSWPTLEILPGGVIKPAVDIDEDETIHPAQKEISENPEEMMYACAKCPQRFKLLFCLVKHVRWHEDEKKREEGNDLSRLNILERDLIALKVARLDVTNRYRKQKLKVMDRIAKAIGDLRAIKGLKHRKSNVKT